MQPVPFGRSALPRSQGGSEHQNIRESAYEKRLHLLEASSVHDLPVPSPSWVDRTRQTTQAVPNSTDTVTSWRRGGTAEENCQAPYYILILLHMSHVGYFGSHHHISGHDASGRQTSTNSSIPTGHSREVPRENHRSRTPPLRTTLVVHPSISDVAWNIAHTSPLIPIVPVPLYVGQETMNAA